MRIGRFERRIIGAIVAVSAVTLAGALVFGEVAVREAYEVGVNPRVLAQLRASLDVYRRHLELLRDDAERTADAVAFDRRGHDALTAGDAEGLGRFLDGALTRYPNVARIVVEAPDGRVVAHRERPGRLDEDEHRLLTLQRPTADGGRVMVTLATDAAPFREYAAAGNMVRLYAQLVGSAGYVRGAFVGFYLAFLLSVIVVVLAMGIIASRRVTRRVAVLAEATERVGRGDLSVEVRSDGKDEVAELTRAFNAMVRDIRESRDRIEYLQRIGAWQEFARRLAHEIKNPLTPIQLSMQQVHRTYRGDDEGYRRTLEDAAAIVDEEVATLRRLVGEFSEFARLPVAALGEADLGAFVRESLRGLDPEALLPADADAPAPALALEVDDAPMPVEIDAQMLRRALDNLVRNAVHAVAASGPESGGRVVVAARLEGDDAVLEVRDDGPGIEPEARERVFDPYFTTKDDGTGLGLAIVKKVVLEHGGAIDCAAAPEGGATFRIRLPVLTPER
ncbi:MAG TPA: ATP-binding protein [Sandaracinaceae bacterium LLY-WYZ-13_1]|nr:ATP-binding protein [Sandaracinaceae bacterium LLY-WYZ-13_1]